LDWAEETAANDGFEGRDCDILTAPESMIRDDGMEGGAS
jgi:hypothetical protein